MHDEPPVRDAELGEKAVGLGGQLHAGTVPAVDREEVRVPDVGHRRREDRCAEGKLLDPLGAPLGDRADELERPDRVGVGRGYESTCASAASRSPAPIARTTSGRSSSRFCCSGERRFWM